MSDIARRIAGLSPEKQKLLLQRLKTEAHAETALPMIQPRPGELHLPFPLTDVQQTYWIGRSGLYDLGNGGTNMYSEVEITGPVEIGVERLQLALQRLIQRHAMLRAIVLPDGEQCILRDVPPYELEIQDWRKYDPSFVEAELKHVRLRMRIQKGQLDRWPLFEFLVYLLNDQLIRLQIRFEAFLLDGTSRSILLRELQQLLCDPEASLPTLECSYRDFAVTWHAFQKSLLYQRARDYWVKRLVTLPPAPALPLSSDISPLTCPDFVVRGALLLEKEAWFRLKSHAIRSGLTPSALVTAAFAEILSRWNHAAPFTIGLLGSYRPQIHSQIRQIFGNFHTIYLLEVAAPTGTFETRARSIQEQILTDLEHRYFSGFQVLREVNRLKGGGSKARMPILFNSILEYSHPSYLYEEAMSDVPGPFMLQEPGSILSIPQVLLMLTVFEGNDGSLVCGCQAVEEVLPQGLSQEILDAYARLLQHLADEEANWKAPEREMILPAQSHPQAAMTVPEGETVTGLPAGLLAPQEPQQQHRTDGTFVAPRDLLQRQLATLWEELLGIQHIGITDNFFELGGTSLLVIHLVNRLRAMYQQQLALSTFFQNEITIEHLANMLRQQRE